VYPIPVITEEEMKAAERELKAAQKHNAKAASVSKRRSLVYDDDDVPQVPVSSPKKPEPKSTETEKSDDKTKEILAPAPLKEDNNKKEDNN